MGMGGGEEELFKPFSPWSLKQFPYLFVKYILQQCFGIAILKTYRYLLIN